MPRLFCNSTPRLSSAQPRDLYDAGRQWEPAWGAGGSLCSVREGRRRKRQQRLLKRPLADLVADLATSTSSPVKEDDVPDEDDKNHE